MNGKGRCEDYADKLAALVLDELPADERASIEAHAASCAACGGELSLLRSTVDALRGLDAPIAELGSARREAIAAHARQALVRPRRGIRWIRVAAAAVFVAGVVGIGFVVFMHNSRSRQRAYEVSRAELAVVRDDKMASLPAAPPAYDPTLKRDMSSSARLMENKRERPVIHLSPDELTQIPKGTDLNSLANKGTDTRGLMDSAVMGVGGGASGAYGNRWGVADVEVNQTGTSPVRHPAVADRDRMALDIGPSALAGPARAKPPARGADPNRDTALLDRERRLRNLSYAAGGSEERPESYSELSPEQRIEDILRSLDPRPGETPDMMFFRFYGDNPFVEAGADPLSTFAVDVDTASYTLMRNYLSRGIVPPREAVRTEEFVNYFRGGYEPPKEKTFAITTELAPSPFAHEPGYQMLRIGIKGREIPVDRRRSCSLVFVIDSSGSMERENRLELVKDALRILVQKLDERDTIGIVTFQTTARKVLDPTGAERTDEILRAIEGLRPGGSTNACDGLVQGYEMAAAHILKGGNNRIILCSDGVANTGDTSVQGILSRVREERAKGIFLTCIGVGMGNHNDELLERLADEGDGRCVYVDRIDEARKVFSETLVGTLETIAKDVKVQVAFDPKTVVLYRLLGYENRDIADQDFRNDAVDAGEIGAGHEVTALYEILTLKDVQGPIAKVTLRWKPVDGSRVGEATEGSAEVFPDAARASFEMASARFRLAAVVAEFAEILRRSHWSRGSTLDAVLRQAEPLLAPLSDDKDVVEFVALVKQAIRIIGQSAPPDELAEAVDAARENAILRARLERLQAEEDVKEIEELRRQNDQLRRKLREILERRSRRGG